MSRSLLWRDVPFILQVITMKVCSETPWRGSGKTMQAGQIQGKHTIALRHSRVCATYTEHLKDYFLKRAPAYEQDNDFHPRLAQTLVALLACISPGDKVLDVATGTGYVAIELARRLGSQGTVVGVDISKPMLQQVRSQTEDLERADSQINDAFSSQSKAPVSELCTKFWPTSMVCMTKRCLPFFQQLHSKWTSGETTCTICA